jgi:DNA-binding NarL/FixJ family response regulator
MTTPNPTSTSAGASTRSTEMRLSPRQEQTLHLLAKGYTVAEIAAALGIAPRTARLHGDALRVKLGIRRLREAPMAYRALTGRDAIGLNPLSMEAS